MGGAKWTLTHTLHCESLCTLAEQKEEAYSGEVSSGWTLLAWWDCENVWRRKWMNQYRKKWWGVFWAVPETCLSIGPGHLWNKRSHKRQLDLITVPYSNFNNSSGKIFALDKKQKVRFIWQFVIHCAATLLLDNNIVQNISNTCLGAVDYSARVQTIEQSDIMLWWKRKLNIVLQLNLVFVTAVLWQSFT